MQERVETVFDMKPDRLIGHTAYVTAPTLAWMVDEKGIEPHAPAIAKTREYVVSRCKRKNVEMLFVHLKRIMRLDRLRLRGMTGAAEEFILAATFQNLRRMNKLIFQVPPMAG